MARAGHTIEADESDALRGNEQRGGGDEVAHVPELRGIPDGGIESGAAAHRCLGRHIGQFRQAEESAGDVLSQGDACGVILSADANLPVDEEPRVSPARQRCREILADKALGKEELQEGVAEGFAELLGVLDGQEEEAAVGGEAPLQHQSVPVGVGPQEIPEGLEGDDWRTFQAGQPAARR